MRAVKHSQLEQIARTAYNTKVPLYVWGKTGIGKSQTVKKVAKAIAEAKKLDFNENIRNINSERNFSIVDIRISQFDPSDLRGLPRLDGDTTRWIPPNWLPKAGSGIIFADEMNLAPPSVQSAMYQLILDRRLGDYVLPEGWSIVGAGNRMEDRAAIFEMAAPLQNRLIHIELDQPSPQDWTDWAIKAGLNTNIVTFINFRPSLLFAWNSKVKEKAFPTPRSWEVTSRLIEGVTELDFMEMLAAASVGEGASMEFASFIRLRDKVDIDRILKNPETEKLPETQDLRYALISAALERYKSKKEVLEPIVKLSLRLEAEYAVMMMNMAHSIHKNHFENNVHSKAIKPAFSEFTKRYSNYIFEAAPSTS